MVSGRRILGLRSRILGRMEEEERRLGHSARYPELFDSDKKDKLEGNLVMLPGNKNYESLCRTTSTEGWLEFEAEVRVRLAAHLTLIRGTDWRSRLAQRAAAFKTIKLVLFG